MIAGARVTATTMPVSTVSASAGPKAWRVPILATPSEAIPAVTTNPAVTMMGANSAVVWRAASTRPRPLASLERMPARKNTE